MRPPTALFACFIVGLAIAALGCANRGMHSDAGAGTAGTAGMAGRGGGTGTAGRGGAGGGAGSAGSGGAATGAAGRGGAGGTGGGGACDLAPGANMAGGACGAMFNFESGTHGAVINAGSTAFTAIAPAGTSASSFCGSGALAITALFSGTSGATTKGEVLINLPGAPVDLTGKTITVHVAANPGCSTDLNLSVVLNTQSGPVYFTPAFPIRPVTNTWKTGTAMVTAVAGSTTALAISVQAFSSTNYTGTIYVDEIDIR